MLIFCAVTLEALACWKPSAGKLILSHYMKYLISLTKQGTVKQVLTDFFGFFAMYLAFRAG